ncbi:MAG: transposase, partial [Chloroflexota bacterium]|nr:transposase [Chloroflexota bacterium]
QLAATIGADGFQLLRAIYAVDAPGWIREVPAVDILRRVWLQQYYAPAADGSTRWRAATDLAPAALLINSPYDPEARYSTKRSVSWTGYKVHLTETCDDDTPHLITHIETTAATATDEQALAPIHAALAQKDLLPADHIVDAGYVDSERLVTSQEDYGVNLLGPIPSDTGWQARAGQGFDVACFGVDWERQTVTCPAGTTSTAWKPTHDRHGKDVIHVEFDRQICGTCAQRPACTRSQTTGRELTIRPQAQHSALLVARQRQTSEDFKEQYAVRAGIEGTISEGVHSCSLRRARYIGQARTHLQHILTAVGLNVQRIAAWFAECPRATTRRSQFVMLMQGTG